MSRSHLYSILVMVVFVGIEPALGDHYSFSLDGPTGIYGFPTYGTLRLTSRPATGIQYIASLNLVSLRGDTHAVYNSSFNIQGRFLNCKLELVLHPEAIAGRLSSCAFYTWPNPLPTETNPTECNYLLGRSSIGQVAGKGFCNFYHTGDNFYDVILQFP